MNRVSSKKARLRRDAAGVRLEHLERRDLLATFPVTNIMDAGPGSLRQAILDNDGSPGLNLISFNIPGAGVRTISPRSPLPAINNAAIVDATTQPGYAGTPLIELNGANIFEPNVVPPTPLGGVDGLVLSGGSSTVKGFTIDRFTGVGIRATQNSNTIAANDIGTDPTGTKALGNQGGGIELDSRGNTIGGSDAASGNLISGNSFFGVYLSQVSSQPADNVVQRNRIGTDLTGTLDLGNTGAGVIVNSSSNLIGGTIPTQGNIIAFNGGSGVQVGFSTFESIARNRILDNSIFSNAGIGIDLGNDGVTLNHPGGSGFGPNNLQNFPALTAAFTDGPGTTIQGTYDAAANTNDTITYYSSPQADPTGYGQGQTFLGSSAITTDANGHADLTTTLPVAVPVGQVISATATDAVNTSEFARSIGVATTAQSDLALVAFDANPTAQAGVSRSFDFRVTNNGPARATGVVFTDTLPQGATFLSGTSTQGALLASSGTVTVNVGTLGSGASARISLTYIVPTPGPVLNAATVRADQPDPVAQNNTVTQNFQVMPASPVDLALFGSATAFPPQIGGDLTYTFVVSNLYQFNAASGVTVTDALPPGLTFVSAQSSQGTVAESNGVVTASLGKLAPGSLATLTVVTRPTGAGLLANTASVSANEVDPDPTNNQATVVLQVASAPQVDLFTLITAAPQPATVGRGLTYAVLVGNAGSATATGVTLANLLPDAASILSITPSQGTVTRAGNAFSVALGTLAPGALAAVTIVLVPGAPGFLVDQAAVSADQPDFNIANNVDTFATPVLVDSSGPSVLNQRLIIYRDTIAGIVLTFNKALDPGLAADPANYRILDLGPNRSAAANGSAVPIASAIYDPASRSVTLTPGRGLAVGRYYQLTVNGEGAPGLVDSTGNALQDLAGGPQDRIYTLLIARGTAIRPVPVQVGAPTPNLSAGNQTSHKGKVHLVKASPRVKTPAHPAVAHHAARAARHG